MKTKIAVLALVAVCACEGATYRVEKAGGAGIFTTITAAVQSTGAGDIIQIGPGVFAENIRVPWTLTFIGAGPQYTTIRGSTTEAAVQGESGVAKTITLQALTIINPTGDGVNTAGYDARIDNCVIANCGRYGVHHNVQSWPTAMLLIRQCTIVSNFSFGIHSPNGVGSASIGVEGTIFSHNNDAGAQNQQDNVQVGIKNASGCMIVGKSLLNFINANCFAATDANFMDPAAGNFILKSPSPAINSGRAGLSDPDGSVHDVGAYGGPGAAAFWPYPAGGPVISSLQVTPVVQQGGKVTVKAAATTR